MLTAYQDDVQKYAAGTLRVEALQHCIQHTFLEAGGRIKFQGFGHSKGQRTHQPEPDTERAQIYFEF